jgi:hypothetical protein
VNICDVDEDNTSKILNQVDHLAELNEPCANEQEEKDRILVKPSAIRIADVQSSSNSSISNKFVSTFQFQFNQEPNKRFKKQITFIKCEPDEQNMQNGETNHKNVKEADQEMRIKEDEDENEQNEANCEVLQEPVEQQDAHEQIQENDSYLSETINTFNHANKTLNNIDYYYCNKLNLNTSNDLTCSLFNTTNNEMENSMIQNEERNKEVQQLLNELLSQIESKQNQVGQNQQEELIRKENEENAQERQMNSSDAAVSSVLNEILKQVERDLVSTDSSNKHEISEPTNSSK